MEDSRKLNYALSYLGRTKTLEELKTLSGTVAAALLTGATKVKITSQTLEGQTSAGVIEMEAVLVGEACEILIRRQEPPAAGERRTLGVVVGIR